MRLEFIRYQQFGENGKLCGLQMEFDNGDQTQVFITELGSSRGPSGKAAPGYGI